MQVVDVRFIKSSPGIVVRGGVRFRVQVNNVIRHINMSSQINRRVRNKRRWNTEEENV